MLPQVKFGKIREFKLKQFMIESISKELGLKLEFHTGLEQYSEQGKENS